MKNVCIFTIASRNYVHSARTLMEGVERFAPGAHRLLALCDERGDFDFSRDTFEVLPLADIELPERKHFIFQYSLLELNTAIKPYVIAALFARGFEKVIYFDPDIALYAPLDDLIGRLDSVELLLTPHVTEPLEDGGRPADRELMICGTFNLGFVAFRRCAASEKFVGWWRRRLERDCVVDFARGLFTDQKWMDFAPSFCAGAQIVRDAGWNVAYWNLAQREVTRAADGRLLVNGASLVFFHFSGFAPDDGVFSKHQDRFTLANLPPVVAELAQDYAARLRGNGLAQVRTTPYAHAKFSDGTPVPDFARKYFREHRDALAAQFPDPAGADADSFIAHLNEPAERNGRSSPGITRLLMEVYRGFPALELEEQFPDVPGAHAEYFAAWCRTDGREFHRLPDVFLRPAEAAQAQKSAALHGGGFNQLVYRLAWRFKDLTHLFVPLKTRQKIAGLLFNRAYLPQAIAHPSARGGSAPAIAGPVGLNVIGYLRAELGVGEAARATLRACRAAGVPAAAVDFSTGVASRLEERIPEGFALAPQYGVTLLHVNADQTPHVVAEHEAAMRGRHNIGFWNWELPELPDSAANAARFLDEVWAPSTFCATAFSRRLSIPVTLVPLSIDVTVPPGVGRRELGLPEDDFLFLFMFDAFSIPERKNPLGLLEAWNRARGSFNRPARLVLKMINGDKESETTARLRAAAARDPAITLLERYLRRPDLNALFNAADCYVSLHRSEGFGLTLAESMFLGKPVIATGWSANMDFMTPWNSLPVNNRLVQLDRDYGPYAKGQSWADPDLDDAARQMVRVVNEPDLAQQLGTRAARDIREQLSPAAVGRIIAARLAALAANRR